MRTSIRSVLAGSAGVLLAALLLPAGPAAAGAVSGPVIFDDNANWYIRTTPTTGIADLQFRYGRGDDLPVVGDWDGAPAGPTGETVGVARFTSAGTWQWFLRNSNSAGPATVPSFAFGEIRFVSVDRLGSIPIAGDWDGDGDATVGVALFDDNTGRIRWQLRNSNTAGPPDVQFDYGRTSTDFPIVGDWDGNGTDTPGVLRSPNTWLLRNALAGGAADVSFTYGTARTNVIELPVPGDWDANNTDTPGLVRNIPDTKPEGGFKHWFIRNSNTSGVADRDFVYGSDAFTEFLPIEFIFRLSMST